MRKSAQTPKPEPKGMIVQPGDPSAIIQDLQEQIVMYSTRSANQRSQFAAALAEKDATIKTLQDALIEQSKQIEAKRKAAPKV